MIPTLTERAPLIPNAVPIGSQEASVLHKKDASELGPLGLTPYTRYGILGGIWVATFLSSLNLTLVPTMLPSISSDFHKSNQASWLGTSYLLATCAFTPLYGRLCDAFGRRGANQTAIAFGAIGTLMCGCSTSMNMLIAARFISGIGGGGIFTTCIIVTSDMFGMRSRGLAQGVASVFNGLGTGLGGPLGGILTDWLGWRWAFLIQMPLFTLSFVLISHNLHYVTPGKGGSTKESLKRIDYGGSATLLISVGSFLVFLSTHYNAALPWSDATVCVPIIIAGVFMVLFFILEHFVTREPILAPFLLKQRIPVLVGLTNFFVAVSNFSVIYFFPMWFQTVMLTSASTAGLHLLPNSVAMAVGAVAAGWLMHHSGKFKMINVVFGSLPFISGVLMIRMRENSSPWQLWLNVVPLGFGNTIMLQTMIIAILVHIPDSQMAVGTGFGQLFRGIGQVAGVAISSAVFQSRLYAELQDRIRTPDAEEVIIRIRQSIRLLGTLPPDLQRIARDSYAASLRGVFVVAACATLIGYLASLLIPDKILEQHPHPPNAENPQAPGDRSLTSPVRDRQATGPKRGAGDGKLIS